MRWMVFVVVLLLAMASSAAIIIHGASLSPALSIPFLMLAWLVRFLFPSRLPPGTSPTTLLALTQALTSKWPK